MRALENAVIRLLKRAPFYGHLLLGLRRRSVAGGGCGITVCNGIPTLIVDTPAFAGLDPDAQEGLLEHLIKHLLHGHMLRRQERHPLLWDAACDLAINPSIRHLPPGFLLPDRFNLASDQCAEEYYRDLRRPFDSGEERGDGSGAAETSGDGGKSGLGCDAIVDARQKSDNHDVWQDAASTPAPLGTAAIRALAAQALQQGQEAPGELASLLDQLLAPPRTPWPQILRQFVATAGRVGRRSSWQREHRRFEHATPGHIPRRRLDLVVGVDVSDSTDVRPLREAFARELCAIAAARQSRITVLYAGSRIQRIDTLRRPPLGVEIYEGGGFTDLRPVFAHASTLQPRPAAIIYLTDGYGPVPEQSFFPTLWVLPPNGRKPASWGVELRLDLEEDS